MVQKVGETAEQQKASVELRALILSPCLRLLNVLLLCWFSRVWIQTDPPGQKAEFSTYLLTVLAL